MNTLFSVTSSGQTQLVGTVWLCLFTWAAGSSQLGPRKCHACCLGVASMILLAAVCLYSLPCFLECSSVDFLLNAPLQLCPRDTVASIFFWYFPPHLLSRSAIPEIIISTQYLWLVHFWLGAFLLLKITELCYICFYFIIVSSNKDTLII